MEYNSLLDEEDTRASMREWILKTFTRRECVRFVKSKSVGDKCGCGRRLQEHGNLLETNRSKEKISANEPRVWRIQDCTKVLETNAFGTLEFQGADTHTTKAEYIRVSFDSKPQNIIKLLKNYWQLELPKLIISIYGGIANFGLQPKLKQAIQKGLQKVANTSHIWIITAATDTGVVKHIGDMLRENFPRMGNENSLIVIGIAPWGVVNEKDSLIGCDIEVPYFSNHRAINLTNTFNLNNCHSYFLLVDDGTVGKYGCEISFRRRLERFLSRHKSEIFMDFDLRPKKLDVTIEEKITLHNHHTIPLVCLVIEGGTNTIQTVLVNVNDKPPVPVVVCDGSGRAADLLAFTHKYAYINPFTKKPTMDLDLKEQLISTIMKTFAYSKNQAEYLFIQLMNCVTNKELISIYRLGDEDNQEIDLAILTASLKVIDLHLNKQFDIIMSWNRPDVAKKYILLEGSEAEKKILEEKMFDALAQDKVDFVKLLLEYGVNLQKFLTFKRMQDLYTCKKGPSNTLILIIKDVIKKMDSSYHISLIDIGLVVEKLIGNGYVSEYSKREFKNKYVKYLSNIPNTKQQNDDAKDSSCGEDLFKYPLNELLIWAVLMKRHEMAMFFCKRGEETLAKALVASKLNKALAKEAELDDLDTEISENFKKYADEFTNLAVGLLDKCYKENDELTSHLLTYDLVNWSHWTCLTLAVSANLKDFLSHAACQLLISDLWMGGMKIRKHVTYKVIAALLFPPALFAIQFKSAKELQYMPQTQEEHEQDLAEQENSSSASSSSSSSSSNSSRSVSRNASLIGVFNNLNLNATTAAAAIAADSTHHHTIGELIRGKSINEHNRRTSCKKQNEESNKLLNESNPSHQSLVDVTQDAEMQRNTRQVINLDQIIEMYDLKNFPHRASTSHQQHNQTRRRSSVKSHVKENTLLDVIGNHHDHHRHHRHSNERNSIERRSTKNKQTMNFIVKNPGRNKLKFGKKIYEFYNAPITKFWQNTLIYILFLIAFAYIVLVKTPKKPSIPEIFVLVYVFTYGLDKIRELLQTDTPRFSGKIKIFFSKVMNSLDMFFIFTILLALIFRLTGVDYLQKVARLIYCVNTIYWIIKLMEFLLVNKYAGVLIIIASRMLVDLMNFVVILLIILMCFGLSRQAIKQPDENFRWELVKKIFLEPYFMLYGEVYADTIDPECDPSKPNEPACQFGHWLTPLTMTIFMIVACLLFLSILIASFNNTFVRISRQSAQFWKCQRYHFVTAFESKPLLAPPFVVISHLYMLIKYAIRLCLRKKIKFDRKLKSFLSEDMVQKLHDFEERCVYLYTCSIEKSMNNLMEEKVNHTRNKVENISARIDDIFFKENMTKLSLYKVELRLQKLEDFMVEAVEHLKNLSNKITTTNNNNNISRASMIENESNRNQPEPVKRSVTATSSVSNGAAANLNTSQVNLMPTRSISASNRKRTITVGDTHTLHQQHQHIFKTIQQSYNTNQTLSKSSLIRLSNIPHVFNHSFSNIETRQKMSEYETSRINDSDDLEIKYLQMNQAKMQSAASKSSSQSLKSNKQLQQLQQTAVGTVTDQEETSVFEKPQSDSDSSDLEVCSADRILKSIYQPKPSPLNSVSSNQDQLINLQASTGLDQYTLHPFVYLHPVIKPPLAEYTSITDCIDTTPIDRPVSPNIHLGMSTKSSNFFFSNNSSEAANLNDYCSNESTRSAVARQESEILRLAEESQHVIISQMLTKLKTKERGTESKSDSIDQNSQQSQAQSSSQAAAAAAAAAAGANLTGGAQMTSRNSRSSLKKPSEIIDEEVEADHNNEKSDHDTHENHQDLDENDEPNEANNQVIFDNETPPPRTPKIVFTTENEFLPDDEDSNDDNNEDKLDQMKPIAFTKLYMNLSEQMPRKTRPKLFGLKKQPAIEQTPNTSSSSEHHAVPPLNALDRNSSQIFYAQANVFSFTNDDIEKDDEN